MDGSVCYERLNSVTQSITKFIIEHLLSAISVALREYDKDIFDSATVSDVAEIAAYKWSMAI